MKPFPIVVKSSLTYLLPLVLCFAYVQTAHTGQLFEEGFVLVKGSCFTMGDMAGDGNPDERPPHEVCLSDYYISKYEVTQKQWQQVMGNNPALNQTDPNFPVDIVSWWHVEEFLAALNSQTKERYRLPTEAEWEFACRAGGKEVRYGTHDGSLSKELAHYASGENEEQPLMPVGSYPPNQLGLYDMAGNVSEWVMDWYDRKYYEKSSKENPVVLDTRLKTLKVRRGGSYAAQDWILRCSHRNFRRPGLRLTGLGFRLAKDVKESD